MNIVIILAGLFAGIISGMGIGGGAILIPALHIFANIDQKIAQSINLMYFIPTAAAALVIHIKKGNVQIKPLIPILLFGMLGALAGGYIAVCLNSLILRRMFGMFLLILAVKELYSAKKTNKVNKN